MLRDVNVANNTTSPTIKYRLLSTVAYKSMKRAIGQRMPKIRGNSHFMDMALIKKGQNNDAISAGYHTASRTELPGASDSDWVCNMMVVFEELIDHGSIVTVLGPTMSPLNLGTVIVTPSGITRLAFQDFPADSTRAWMGPRPVDT
jgi:hypothetical protein